MKRNKTEKGAKKPSDQPELSTETQEIKETPTGDEWDTDLEPEDNVTSRGQSSLREEQYLQACQHIGVTPISSFLRHLDEAILNLNHYHLQPLEAKALAIALKNDVVITHLELEDNFLQAKGTLYLMRMLQDNYTIHSLNLSKNQLGFEGANIISKILLKNYNIKTLKLSGNNFDDSAAKYLAEALKDDFVLKELDLSNNQFGEAGSTLLGQMLDRNSGIEVLNLSWNDLHLGAVAALGSSLKENSTLTHLQLSHCCLGSMEAECLGQALKENGTLVLLDISGNSINDQAVTLLCKGLSANCTLRVLKLFQNPITKSGALTLLKTVQNVNSAMEAIDISSVCVCEAFVELLNEVRLRRPSLEVQYILLNSVTRNVAALPIFEEFLKERNESLRDFFQGLDKEETMTVSTSDFRKAVQKAKVPLNKQQISWLVKKFDEKCTATIKYSQFC